MCLTYRDFRYFIAKHGTAPIFRTHKFVLLSSEDFSNHACEIIPMYERTRYKNMPSKSKISQVNVRYIN